MKLKYFVFRDALINMRYCHLPRWKFRPNIGDEILTSLVVWDLRGSAYRVFIEPRSDLSAYIFYSTYFKAFQAFNY